MILGLGSVSQPDFHRPQSSRRLGRCAPGENQESALCGVAAAWPRGDRAREWSFQPLVFKMGGHVMGSARRPTALGLECPFATLPPRQIHAPQGHRRPRPSRAHPTLGSGRPPPGEAWEMGEVVRLVSGVWLGIHAGWQALRGVGALNPASGAGEATPPWLCFRPSKATLWCGCRGQQALRRENPVFRCEQADRPLSTTPPNPHPRAQPPPALSPCWPGVLGGATPVHQEQSFDLGI